MPIAFHGQPTAPQRRFAELVDAGSDPEGLVALLADDLAYEDWQAPGRQFAGRTTFLDDFNGPIDAAFADVRYPVEEAFAAADHLLLRGHFEGTFTGDYFGFPAHGRPVRWEFRDLYRFDAHGRVDRIWFANDTLVVARQLGAIPLDERLW